MSLDNYQPSPDSAWCVYGLTDPRNGEVRYIGFTYQLARRLREHERRALRNEIDYPVARWIRALHAAGLRFGHTVFAEGRGGWDDTEERLIAEHRAAGARLLNVLDTKHFIPPPESRRRAGEKLRGRRQTPEHIKNSADARRGKPRPHTRGKRGPSPLRGIPLNISSEERERRREAGRVAGRINGAAMWASMSPEDRKNRSAAARAQMRRVWEERKAGLRRSPSQNHGTRVVANGHSRSIPEWARMCGLSHSAIRRRLARGLSPEAAVAEAFREK